MADEVLGLQAEAVERSLRATAETLVELADAAAKLGSIGGSAAELAVLAKVVLECNQAVLAGMAKCLDLSQAPGRS